MEIGTSKKRYLLSILDRRKRKKKLFVEILTNAKSERAGEQGGIGFISSLRKIQLSYAKAKFLETWNFERLFPPKQSQPQPWSHQMSLWDNPTLEQSSQPETNGTIMSSVTGEEWRVYGRYLWGYWRPYWSLGILSGGLLMGLSIYGMVYAASLKILLDKLIVAKKSISVLPVIVKLVAALPVAFALTLTGDWLATRLTSRISSEIRHDLLKHMQTNSLDYYKREKLGDLIAHFSGDIPNVERGMGRVMLRITTKSFSILVNILLMAWIEWHLALYVLFAVPLTAYMVKRYTPDTNTANRLMRNREGLVASAVNETLRAQPMIKSFGIQRFIQDSYDIELRKLEKSNTNAMFKIGIIVHSSDASSYLVDVSSVGLGILLVVGGVMSITTLVAFQALLVTLRRELVTLLNDFYVLIQAVASIGRLDHLFQQRTELVDAEDAMILPPFQREIRFNQVAFSYTGREYQLDGIDLIIGAREFVAFVGPSGAGKSTILNLLLRFYDVTAGQLSIDGYDVRTVTQASLRANMGVVLQETFIFNSTILNNILVAKPDASEAEAIEAAKAAELHDFIMTLPDGYQSNVGEGGGRLSGGQKQRIGIARAMLVNPAILVLDEATSSLDADTAAAVQATIEKIAQERTVITISHILSSVVNADKIYVLEHGHLLEQGTHQSLLRAGGLYYKLWQTQNNHYELSMDNKRDARSDRTTQTAIS